MLSGFRRRRKTQEQTSGIRRRRGYCSIACWPLSRASRELRSRRLAGCLWLEIWEQRCSAQGSIYFCSFAIPQTNLSLFSCILSFPVIFEEKSGFYARPLFFRSQVRTSFQVCLTFLTNGADWAKYYAQSRLSSTGSQNLKK